jgi:DNA-binding response OmpR family regulator
MQLLIVHDDAEVGEQLVGMVHDYSEHQCDLVESDAAALKWAREHARCGLLLAQLEAPGIDGLTLGGSLS